jgi:hypothetical protein
MDNKDAITLPGEEGEWESVEYEYRGDISSNVTIVFREWPGASNIRVFVRKKEEPELPSLYLYDGVFVDGRDNQNEYVYGNFVVIGTKADGWATIADIAGKQFCVPLSIVARVYRNGEKIYGSP